MILNEGDHIDLGGKVRTDRTKSRGGYDYTFPAAASFFIDYGVLTRFNVADDWVELVRPEYINDVLKLPLSFEPLGIGRLGIRSFVPPLSLPFDHPGCITELSSNFMCMHRRTNTKCRLRLDVNFDINGVYTLTPVDGGEARSFTSHEWTRQNLAEHLELQKGSVPMGRAIVRGFVLETRGRKEFKSSQAYSRINTPRSLDKVSIVTAHPDLSLNFFPAHLIIPI